LRAANRSLLHEAAWRRFYAFIQECHATQVPCAAGDLVQLLEESGFHKRDALEAASVYHHGRALLQQRE
jgi:hypothetical protein